MCVHVHAHMYVCSGEVTPNEVEVMTNNRRIHLFGVPGTVLRLCL